MLTFTVYTKDIKADVIESSMTKVITVPKKAYHDQMELAKAIRLAMNLDGNVNEVTGLNQGSKLDICFKVTGNPNLRWLCRLAKDIEVKTSVSMRRLADMLIGAFEGGSTYWAQSVKYLGQPCAAKLIWYDCPELLQQEGAIFSVKYDDPEKQEGNGKGHKIVMFTDLVNGLNIMSAKYPRHFADMVNENDDNTTQDVYFQCVVLGDVIYG